VRRLDVSAMFASLWLLTSMIIDVLTPKELTAYMIAAATAPGLVILAILYGRGVSRQDFAIAFGVLWLVTAIILEFLAPRPLSLVVAFAIAGTPPVIVGCFIYYRHWRRARRRTRSSQQ
jgi:hypothetical protein